MPSGRILTARASHSAATQDKPNRMRARQAKHEDNMIANVFLGEQNALWKDVCTCERVVTSSPSGATTFALVKVPCKKHARLRTNRLRG